MQVFLVLAAAASAAHGFSLLESRPKSVTVKEGGEVELFCAVDDWWEWCTFKRADAAICDFEWRKDVYNVTVLDCAAFAGRFEFIGDYNSYQCGIRLKDVRPEDAGEWSCDFENYYSGQTRNYGYKVSGKMSVDVEVITTTTTGDGQQQDNHETTTTTSTTSSDSEYNYEEYEEEDSDDEDDEEGAAGGESGAQSGDENKTRKGGKDDDGMTFIIIPIALVAFLIVVLVLALLYFKRKLPACVYELGGKGFKPVNPNDTTAGLVGDEEEAKHPSIVKNGGAKDSEKGEEAAVKEGGDAKVDPALTKVEWTAEDGKKAEEAEKKDEGKKEEGSEEEKKPLQED